MFKHENSNTMPLDESSTLRGKRVVFKRSLNSIYLVNYLLLCECNLYNKSSKSQSLLQNIIIKIRLIGRLLFLLALLYVSNRAAVGKAASMCGPREMVVAMTTATVMDTPPACGPSLLIQPSMMDALHFMTKAAHPR